MVMKNDGKYIFFGIAVFVFVIAAMSTFASNSRYYAKKGRYPKSPFRKKSKGVRSIRSKKKFSKGPYLPKN
jgi:hypothetical protein